MLDKSVGTKVRMERIAKGLTQQALAEALGVSFQQVQKYEKGANRITASRISQICEALGIALDRILDTSGNGTNPGNEALDKIQSFLATKQGSALMTAFVAIEKDAVRREIVELIESISASQSSSTNAKPERVRTTKSPRLARAKPSPKR